MKLHFTYSVLCQSIMKVHMLKKYKFFFNKDTTVRKLYPNLCREKSKFEVKKTGKEEDHTTSKDRTWKKERKL